MTIWCGGMLRSITRNAHAIAVAVTVIAIEGQWFSRKCLADIRSCSLMPDARALARNTCAELLTPPGGFAIQSPARARVQLRLCTNWRFAFRSPLPAERGEPPWAALLSD